jgi:hypothetical protein
MALSALHRRGSSGWKFSGCSESDGRRCVTELLPDREELLLARGDFGCCLSLCRSLTKYPLLFFSGDEARLFVLSAGLSGVSAGVGADVEGEAAAVVDFLREKSDGIGRSSRQSDG